MSTATASLGGRARGILSAYGIKVSELSPRGKNQHQAQVSFEVPSGTLEFQLRVGVLKAGDRQALPPESVFCPAIRRVLELSQKWGFVARISSFQKKAKIGNDDHYLEIVVLTGPDGIEAVLVLKLRESHFNMDAMKLSFVPDEIPHFFSQECASFAVLEGMTAAMAQFTVTHPKTVFLTFQSPMDYFLVRCFDPRTNLEFIEFLKAKFAGMCSIYPAGIDGLA